MNTQLLTLISRIGVGVIFVLNQMPLFLFWTLRSENQCHSIPWTAMNIEKWISIQMEFPDFYFLYCCDVNPVYPFYCYFPFFYLKELFSSILFFNILILFFSVFGSFIFFLGSRSCFFFFTCNFLLTILLLCLAMVS